MKSNRPTPALRAITLIGGVFCAAFGLAGVAPPALAQADVLVETPEPAPTWDEEVLLATPALSLDGKVGEGERAYEVCSYCHLAGGGGRADGSVPQLAGQHTSVLIKQMTDIREKRRENPIMYPFARMLIDPQKLANIAAYIETLPIPRENGKGPGTHLPLGQELYESNCQRCHGENGAGNAQEFTPVLAGQHYEYLLRQVRDISEGWRRNNHPEMSEVISGYTPEQLSAVVDYASRLEWPERQEQH